MWLLVASAGAWSQSRLLSGRFPSAWYPCRLPGLECSALGVVAVGILAVGTTAAGIPAVGRGRSGLVRACVAASNRCMCELAAAFGRRATRVQSSVMAVWRQTPGDFSVAMGIADLVNQGRVESPIERLAGDHYETVIAGAPGASASEKASECEWYSASLASAVLGPSEAWLLGRGDETVGRTGRPLPKVSGYDALIAPIQVLQLRPNCGAVVRPAYRLAALALRTRCGPRRRKRWPQSHPSGKPAVQACRRVRPVRRLRRLDNTPGGAAGIFRPPLPWRM